MAEQKYQPIKASVGVNPQTNDIAGTAMLLSDENVAGISQCMGVATVAPGEPETAMLAHSTSEVMFVAQGTGQLITTEGTVEFTKGDAIFIPADLRHALKNTGDDVLVSVFSFPSPNRPADSNQPH